MSFYRQRQVIMPEDPAASHYFGYAVAGSSDTFIVGAYGDADNGASAGAAYVYALSADGVFVLQQKLLASDGVANDWFGDSVAIDGDTCMVGADGDDTFGANSGSIYAFTRAAGVWTQQQKLNPLDAAANDYFGYPQGTTSISGDTFAAGLAYKGSNGAVYIFTRAAGVWTQQQKIVAADGAASDAFGCAVALSSDGNTVAIGASGDDDTFAGSGSVYIWSRSGGVWTQQQKLHASNPAASRGFGRSLAFDGTSLCIASIDYVYFFSYGASWVEDQFFFLDEIESTPSVALLGDMCLVGLDRLKIGAPWYYYGDAYYFIKRDGTWYFQSRKRPRDYANNRYFGLSVGIAGSYNIVSEPEYTDSFVDQGRVFVYDELPTTDLNFQQVIRANDPITGNKFGSVVAISGDTVISGDYANSANTGAAYIHLLTGGIWTEQQKLTASDGVAGDRFSDLAVAIDGDTCIVGAFAKAGSQGAAYVFTRAGGIWTEQQKLTASDGAAGDEFGYSVAVEGDMALVGARLDDDGAANSGSVYFFTRAGGVWTEQAKLAASDPTGSKFFGNWVSLSGDTCIIAAKGDSTIGAWSGAAYIFTYSGGVWTQQAKLMASDGAASDWFGTSVAIDGDRCIVGAYNKDGGRGAAYVFTRTMGVWDAGERIDSTARDTTDQFGYAVAIKGTIAIVGAYFSTVDGEVRTGYACKFEFVDGAWRSMQRYYSYEHINYSYFGIGVAVSEDYVVVGANGDWQRINGGCGATYIFTVEPAVSYPCLQKLDNYDPVASEWYGSAISVSGNTYAIGCYKDNLSDPTQIWGAVYVYTKSGSTLTLEQKIDSVGHQDPLHRHDSYFGWAVALYGDTLAIGCPWDNNGVDFWDTGSLFFFERAGGVWNFAQKIFDPAYTVPGSAFGSSIAMDATTCVVGSHSSDNWTGAAHVFLKSGGVWAIEDSLEASDKTANSMFGSSCGLSGDTCIIGCPESLQGGIRAGAAYIYTRAGGVWTEQQKLTAPVLEASSLYGYAVLVSGDTCFVGAPFATYWYTGKVFVYTRVLGAWSLSQTLVPSISSKEDGFGITLALQGDTLVVGAYCTPDLLTQVGAAYVFKQAGGVWTEHCVIFPPDEKYNMQFGGMQSFCENRNIAVTADETSIAVGSMFDTNGTISEAGSAYIFAEPSTGATRSTADSISYADALTILKYNLGIFQSTAAASGAGVAVPRRFRDLKIWRPFKSG